MRNARPLFAKLPILVAVLLGLAGCIAPAATVPAATTPQATGTLTETSTSVTNTVTDTASAGAEVPALTEEELANTSYPLDLSATGTITLENGEYREPLAPGSASELVVKMDQVAYGDLNGDDVDDAAVILVSDPGGSGTFYHVNAVLNQAGEPEAVASALLGDRIKLQSLAIAGEEITVEMITQGPQDPMCCPTQEVTRTYQLEDNQLVLTSTTEPK